jgi:uncharacterized protein DUF6636
LASRALLALRGPSATLLVTIASLILIGPAVSGTPGLLGLKTPTGNIQCMIDDYGLADGSYPPLLRCDIREMASPLPPRPDRCEFDWGSAFSIAQEDQTGHRLCVSDSVASDRWEVLGYGAVWQQLGLTCLLSKRGSRASTQSGMASHYRKHRKSCFSQRGLQCVQS